MKLSLQSIAEKVYNHLLNDIMKGVRAAGSKLSEESICSELGVSRTPAREALMLLDRDGMIERIPRRGCFVKSFDTDEIAELFQCRIWIEALALQHGFDHIPDNELAKLETALSDRSKRTQSAALKLDDRLHQLIVESCPNRHLREVAEKLLIRTYPFRYWRTNEEPKPDTVSNERLQIVQAIRKRDKAAALRLLKAHILNGQKMILKIAANRASQSNTAV